MECTIVVPAHFGKVPISPSSKEILEVPRSIVGTPKLDFGISIIRECLLNKCTWLLIGLAVDIEPGKIVKTIKLN